MATIKKPMAKKAMMMKKSAKKAAPMMSPAMGGGPMMKKGGKIKKYQNSGAPVKPSPDSTAYYKKESDKALKNYSSKFDKPTSYSEVSAASNKLTEADRNLKRQSLKGKPGYDKDGFPIKKNKTGGVTKKKMQAGGVAGKQTKAGMVDPKGAYTKVQMRTLGSMKKGGKISKKK